MSYVFQSFLSRVPVIGLCVVALSSCMVKPPPDALAEAFAGGDEEKQPDLSTLGATTAFATYARLTHACVDQATPGHARRAWPAAPPPLVD